MIKAMLYAWEKTINDTCETDDTATPDNDVYDISCSHV